MQVKYLAQGCSSSVLPGNRTKDLQVPRLLYYYIGVRTIPMILTDSDLQNNIKT
uniref:Uncharacterized protein n=1 Tax=Anguilla anguilla TaxID=7936 RepID=A0A0E9T640_ANGAN